MGPSTAATGHVPRKGAARSSARSAAGPAVAPFVEAIGPAGDALEREADRIADVVARGGLGEGPIARWSAANVGDGSGLRSGEREAPATIRRAPKVDAGTAAPVAQPEPQPPPSPAPVVEPVAQGPAERTAPALLAEDDAESIAAGQMRRTEFLAALRGEICGAVDGALSGTGRDSQGCPWIDHWLGDDEERSAPQIEQSLRRFAPEAARAKDTAAVHQDRHGSSPAQRREVCQDRRADGDAGRHARQPDARRRPARRVRRHVLQSARGRTEADGSDLHSRPARRRSIAAVDDPQPDGSGIRNQLRRRATAQRRERHPTRRSPERARVHGRPSRRVRWRRVPAGHARWRRLHCARARARDAAASWRGLVFGDAQGAALGLGPGCRCARRRCGRIRRWCGGPAVDGHERAAHGDWPAGHAPAAIGLAASAVRQAEGRQSSPSQAVAARRA